MKRRDLKDLALAINYHALECRGYEFENSDINNTEYSQYVYEYIQKEREKIVNRISDYNKGILAFSDVESMVQFLTNRGEFLCIE